MLTFNPGWDSNAQTLASFTDVRELQRQLKAQGVTFVERGGRKHDGPGELHRGRIRTETRSSSTSTSDRFHRVFMNGRERDCYVRA